MRKLFRLKSWYTLEEAAARLSLTLSEPVSEGDIVQLAAEGQIKVCWFLKGDYLGRKVTVYCDYPRNEQVDLFSDPDYDAKGESWGHYLNGIFELPINLCPAWGWWILTFVGKGGESGNWCGALVIEEDGTIWELYEPGNKGDFFHYPKKEDVVIRTADLEAFERLANGEPEASVPAEVNGKSETSYLNIIGALSDLYWREKFPDQPKINQSKLIDELRSYDGYSGMSERNLKDKLSKAIKAIRNE